MSRVRELNDRFRQTGTGGRVMVTRGVAAAGVTFISRALEAVRSFDAFTEDNDPHGEHGSDDPADPEQTTRVLTIMLAEEY